MIEGFSLQVYYRKQMKNNAELGYNHFVILNKIMNLGTIINDS